MSPECEALVEAAAGMSVEDLAQELAQSDRVQDPTTLAAYLISQAG